MYNDETLRSDEENSEYARYMSLKIPEVTISYETLSECDVVHGNSLPCGRGTDMKKVLTEHHPRESVFRPGWLDVGYISAEELLERIERDDCGPELDASFVVIKAGAFEAADDHTSRVTGFCLQRLEPSPDELGEFALNMAAQSLKDENSGLDPREYVKRRCAAGAVTTLRKRFHKDTCVSVKNLRWLMKYRDLTGVEIIHLIYYANRNFLTDFIHKLLQERHDLVRAGKKNTLTSMQLKTLTNSIYGREKSESKSESEFLIKIFFFLEYLQESSKYFGYTIVGEHNLNGERMGNVTDLTVIGVTRHKGQASLLYLARRDKKEARINNLLQEGALILANSRKLYSPNIIYNRGGGGRGSYIVNNLLAPVG